MKKLFVIWLVVLAASPLSAQKLFSAKEDGKFGYVDDHGNWVIPAKFDDAKPFSNGRARVMIKERWGYINEKGEMTSSLIFQAVYDYDGDVARVKEKKSADEPLLLFGLIDKQGKWIVRPSFLHVKKFSDNGLARAKNEKGDWGFIDQTGKWVIQPVYGGLRDFRDGLAMARSKGSWGYIDEKGNWAIQPTYNHVFGFSEGAAIVEAKGGWKLIDKENKQIGNMTFSAVKPFRNGLAVVRTNKWGAIDKQGNWVIEPKFDYLDDFMEGRARARQNALWGAINEKGEWVIKPELTSLFDFSDGIAQVKKITNWGYIDLNGSWIVSPKFQNAEKFINGSAIVKLNNKWGIIDKQGNFTAEPKFDKLRSLVEEEEVEDTE